VAADLVVEQRCELKGHTGGREIAEAMRRGLNAKSPTSVNIYLLSAYDVAWFAVSRARN
jgi:hypothetical protein